MRTTAVICEFNPIHFGHTSLLATAGNSAECDCVIAVMSGNFTQRCTPAVYDKYTRAHAALLCGADIVLELPFPWCASSAETFALGGVTVAGLIGADSLTFGSESGDIELLKKAAGIKNNPEFALRMAQEDKRVRGHGSATVFDEVMEQYGISSPLGANDKLGSDYIRFAAEFGINDFRPVRRSENPSATEIRNIICSSGFAAAEELIPREAYDIYRTAEICTEEKYNEILFTHCRLYIGKDELNELLRYAAKKAAECTSPDEFIPLLPTKKYTASRMRREILYSILGVNAEITKTPPRFTQLLAANEKGRRFLAENRDSTKIPIITKPADCSETDESGKLCYALHKSADELYAFLIGQRSDRFIKAHPVMM